MNKSSQTIWNLLLLAVRIWLGYIMMTNGRFFFKMMESSQYRDFFRDWFGNSLHIPFPLFMAYVAKGAEFFGGLLVLLGLFTRVGGVLIACTMLVATLVANLGKAWEVDGTITTSLCLFALVCVYWGGGRYALDGLLRRKSVPGPDPHLP